MDMNLKAPPQASSHKPLISVGNHFIVSDSLDYGVSFRCMLIFQFEELDKSDANFVEIILLITHLLNLVIAFRVILYY